MRNVSGFDTLKTLLIVAISKLTNNKKKKQKKERERKNGEEEEGENRNQPNIISRIETSSCDDDPTGWILFSLAHSKTFWCYFTMPTINTEIKKTRLLLSFVLSPWLGHTHLSR